MAPFLEDFDLLALDFAGHGLSAHRPASSRYYFSEYLYDLDALLDQLGWGQCHLMGHSMGGGVASLFAAALPERVDRLVLLDAVGALARPIEQTARQLRLSLKSVRKDRSNLRPYKNVEAAMRARQKDSALSDQAARLLCERSLTHSGQHYQWSTDPRLNWRSPQLYTDDQMLDVLAAIRAPTLAITSPEVVSYLGEKMMRQRLGTIARCQHMTVEDHHHFHMEQAAHIGACITDFLLEGEP